MWESFCEALQYGGRRAGLFILVILLCAVAGPLWEKGGAFAYAGLVAIWALHSLSSIWKSQPPRGHLGKLPPLARHDLVTARSKLKRSPCQRQPQQQR